MTFVYFIAINSSNFSNFPYIQVIRICITMYVNTQDYEEFCCCFFEMQNFDFYCVILAGVILLLSQHTCAVAIQCKLAMLNLNSIMLENN